MTYDEMLTVSTDVALKNRVQVALVVAAEKIRIEDPRTTVNAQRRKSWASDAFYNPGNHVNALLWAVLAQNRALTLAQVTGASDAAIQSAVDAAIDALAV